MKKIIVMLSILVCACAPTKPEPQPSHFHSSMRPGTSYVSIYDNYETSHAIDKTSGSHTFSVTKNNPGDRFRVFVPPGATYISLMVYAERNALIGVAARSDLEPRCNYNTNQCEDQFSALPWKSPGDPGLSWSGYRGHDLQFKNRGGTIKVVEKTLPREKAPGEWLFVRVLRYDSSRVPKLTYTVSVDVPTYQAWYKPEVFTNGQPPLNTGIGGGNCNPAWSALYSCPCENEEQQKRDCEENEAMSWNSQGCRCEEKKIQPCNVFEMFACRAKGNTFIWRPEPDCECVEIGDPCDEAKKAECDEMAGTWNESLCECGDIQELRLDMNPVEFYNPAATDKITIPPSVIRLIINMPPNSELVFHKNAATYGGPPVVLTGAEIDLIRSMGYRIWVTRDAKWHGVEVEEP